MRALGITRNVDALGRIVIPKEVRKALNIAEGTAMEMLSDDNGVYMRRYVAGCTFCNGMDNLVEFGGTRVCKVCASMILNKPANG
jgi:transcriptional pleiotropic regulator of transition state genes